MALGGAFLNNAGLKSLTHLSIEKAVIIINSRELSASLVTLYVDRIKAVFLTTVKSMLVATSG